MRALIDLVTRHTLKLVTCVTGGDWLRERDRLRLSSRIFSAVSACACACARSPAGSHGVLLCSASLPARWPPRADRLSLPESVAPSVVSKSKNRPWERKSERKKNACARLVCALVLFHSPRFNTAALCQAKLAVAFFVASLAGRLVFRGRRFYSFLRVARALFVYVIISVRLPPLLKLY